MKRRDLLLGTGAVVTGFGLSSMAAVRVPAVAAADRTDFSESSECRSGTPSEPNIEGARLWWPEPRNVWTPIGWKDHLFRFNSVYNGTLLCSPGGWMKKPDTLKYRGTDFQLNFTPSADGKIPPIPAEYT